MRSLLPLGPVDYNFLGLHMLEFDRHRGESSESLLEEHLKEGHVDVKYHVVPIDILNSTPRALIKPLIRGS